MASVAEVQAAIDAAIEKLREAERIAANCGNALSEAIVGVDWIRETSVDPMGSPSIISAIEHADNIGHDIIAAIEALQTYRGTL